MTPVTQHAYTWRRAMLWAAAMFLAALFVRLIGSPMRPVHVDEYLHIFAARSWIEDGSFHMIYRDYPRARLFTMLVGSLFSLTGNESFLIARLPAAFAGALTVAVLFWWLNRVAGAIPAWLAAMLLTFDPLSVDASQLIRFYTIQALLVLVAVALLYDIRAATVTRRARVWRIGLAGVAMLLALHFQITTIVPIAVLIGLIAVELCVAYRAVLFPIVRRYRLPIALAAVIALIGLAWAIGLALPLLNKTNLTTGADATNKSYYLYQLSMASPVLAFLLPVAAIVAIDFRPRLAILSIAIFAAGFLAQSVGAMKSARYIAYIMPFYCALWGLAAAALLPAARRLGERLTARAAGYLDMPASRMLDRAGFCLVVLTAAGGVLVASEGFRMVAKHTVNFALQAATDPAGLVREPLDSPWSEQAESLRAAIPATTLLVTESPLSSAYFVRAPDMWLRSEGKAFARGGQMAMMGTPTDVAMAVRCVPDGLVVVSKPDVRWRLVDRETHRAIEGLTSPVRPQIRDFALREWHSPVDDSAGCRMYRDHLGFGRNGHPPFATAKQRSAP